MAVHASHHGEVDSRTEPDPARWLRRLILLLAMLAAGAVAAVAGIAVAGQLTRLSTVAPATRHEPNAGTGELPTLGAGASGAPRQGVSEPRQEYVRRLAYVRGKLVWIRIRSDAANVGEDRTVSK